MLRQNTRATQQFCSVCKNMKKENTVPTNTIPLSLAKKLNTVYNAVSVKNLEK